MEFIKEWTLNISITLIVSTALSLIAPKNGTGKLFKITLSVFILISFLQPFVNNNVNISFPEFENAYIDEEKAVTYEEVTNAQVKSTLVQGGFDQCTVDCKLSIYGDEIYINKLMISIPDIYNKKEVENYIYDNMGLLAEVYYVGE